MLPQRGCLQLEANKAPSISWETNWRIHSVILSLVIIIFLFPIDWDLRAFDAFDNLSTIYSCRVTVAEYLVKMQIEGLWMKKWNVDDILSFWKSYGVPILCWSNHSLSSAAEAAEIGLPT